MNDCVTNETANALYRNKFPSRPDFKAPTALDIMEQLTYAFLTKKSDGMWQCSRIGEGRAIFNSNTCPHEACAKTWIELVNRNNEPNLNRIDETNLP